MAKKTAQQKAAEENDANIMATNDSSIVSKRSAELVYHQEPHFIKYFVQRKKVRRSPLISRGYWLRMKAVETVVRRFLDESLCRKVIVNLGAGYDALPFDMLAKESELCKNATFVDVDYPQLLQRKYQMIKAAPALMDLLGDVSISDGETVLLRSKQYMLAGCDLNRPEQLKDFLLQNFEQGSHFLFVAEVSIAYMETGQANDVIALTATVPNARFCLLEQTLPRGPSHPFARTMLAHFRKVKGELKSVERYSSLSEQERRFRDSGWASARARSLWQLWSDSGFISSTDRSNLNSKEPFDEWEDFSLFASHYLVLVASNKPSSGGIHRDQIDPFTGDCAEGAGSSPDSGMELYASETSLSDSSEARESLTIQPRRFGSIYNATPSSIGIHGGYVDGAGENGRTSSSSFITSRRGSEPPASLSPTHGIVPRMCHTITTIDNEHLLVGGRASPNVALADCWLGSTHGWTRVEDLPQGGLYRHAATSVSTADGQRGVLIYGGRTVQGEARGDWLLWQETIGWLRVTSNISIVPRFGSTIASEPTQKCSGILLGGMAEEGIILPDCYKWELQFISGNWQITLAQLDLGSSSSLQRIGASLLCCPDGYYLMGGTGIQGILTEDEEIVKISYGAQPKFGRVKVHGGTQLWNDFLLVGHHALCGEQGILVVGGGAVCFAFGAYWNRFALQLNLVEQAEPSLWWLLDVKDKEDCIMAASQH